LPAARTGAESWRVVFRRLALALAVDAPIGGIECWHRRYTPLAGGSRAVVLVAGTAVATLPPWPKSGGDRTVVVGAELFPSNTARPIGERSRTGGLYRLRHRDGLAGCGVRRGFLGGDIDVRSITKTIWANEDEAAR
jgi:osmoprotectant transport system permease protein